jgi:mannitol/fructose-specific phosphotransferase system IIA component (Ntr-type)
VEDIQDSLTGRAAAVVALFGQERGPETLVEVGKGLAGRGTVEVAHVAEVPEQLQLGDVLQEEAKVRSLRRRFSVMAEQEHFKLEFHSIASRDIVHTVHSVTRSVHCDWLVMAWRGRGRTALLPYNPIGWLINHLDCNLALFKDAGVRYMREIVVHAEPGPHDALVVGSADELAQQWRAQLTLVRFVAETDSEQAVAQEAGYLDQLAALCSSPTSTKILRGKTFLGTLSSATASYDLLVAGMPDTTLLRQITGTVEDSLMRRAECSVLLLKTPRVRTHEAYEKRTRHVSGASPLLDHLAVEAVQPQLSASKKDALFQHCARVFEPLLQGTTQKEIYDALWERERTQNTSVGHGVALPHATLPHARAAVVGVFTTREPIDYQGPDGQRVDVFFVPISPPSERQLHLQLLSGIAALSLKTSLLERLRAAGDADEILAAVRECSFQLPTE